MLVMERRRLRWESSPVARDDESVSAMTQLNFCLEEIAATSLAC